MHRTSIRLRRITKSLLCRLNTFNFLDLVSFSFIMSWWPFGKKAETAIPAAEPEKPKKKICCACPDTKRLRDECIATHGENEPYCKALIEAHKACLRMEGFNV